MGHLEKWGEPAFQSQQIFTSKCSVFNKKVTRYTKKEESVAHSEEKNTNNRNSFEKNDRSARRRL